MLGREALEAALDAGDLGQPADAVLHVGIAEFRFCDGEQAEAEEGPSRQRRQEVRIAAPGIQHQPVFPAGGELDQLVLQLEGAQLGILRIVDGHGASPAGSGKGDDEGT